MFPAFAHIAQMALNTANHVSIAVGEFEIAVTLSACADDPGKEKGWEALAVENVISLCVPCAHYAHVILNFCSLYGGGAGAPLIRFMDNVAKQFQVNVILGENMWSAVKCKIRMQGQQVSIVSCSTYASKSYFAKARRWHCQADNQGRHQQSMWKV